MVDVVEPCSACSWTRCGATIASCWRSSRAMDDTLDRLHNAVKLHLTAISREDGLERGRRQALLGHSRLHHQPRAHRRHLDKSLREIAAKKIKQRLTFSPEGLQEIAEMHQTSAGQPASRHQRLHAGRHAIGATLLAEKDRMRDLEQAATDNHLRRLREGRRRASRPARCTSTSPATSSGSRPTSPRWPIRSLSRAASCAAAACGRKTKAAGPAKNRRPRTGR